jgi:sugar phosphate permease
MMLVAVRFLMGAASAPLFPAVGALIQRWFPLGSWGLPNGLTSTGLTLGAAVIPVLLAWLMLDMDWRSAYLVIAPLGLAAAALCWWYLRDGPEEHASVNAEELALIASNRPAVAVTEDEAPAWVRVLKNRNMQMLTLSYFCANYVFYNLFNWVPHYFAAVRGFDEQQAGFVISIQWIMAAIGATLGGFACDYITRRAGLRKGCRRISFLSMAAAGLFLLLASLPIGASAVVAFLALGIFFMQIIEAPYWAAAIGIGGKHTAAAGGMMNTGGNAVGVLNALLVPFVANLLGWSFAMATAGIFALVAAGLWFFINADEQIPD